MTVTEFKNEFNILYDSISSNSAPGLDDYEISVFLTKAQEIFVKNKFEENSNRLQKGFEQSSKRRNDLKELIKNYNTNLEQTLDKHIIEGTTFYIIPSDVFIPIQESAVIQCGQNMEQVTVTPKTHDEFNSQVNNPFKKPYRKEVWRLDYSSKEAGNAVVELYSTSPIVRYNLRYIKYPSPIIVSDLTTFNEGLSINTKTQPATSELNQSTHSEILNKAVELAILAYRENNLSNNVQVNLQNE